MGCHNDKVVQTGEKSPESLGKVVWADTLAQNYWEVGVATQNNEKHQKENQSQT